MGRMFLALHAPATRPAVLAVVVGLVLAAYGGSAVGSPDGAWSETPVRFPSGGDRLYGILTEPWPASSGPALVLLTGSGRAGVSDSVLVWHARELPGAPASRR